MENWQEIDKYFVLYTGTIGMLVLCVGTLLFYRVYHRRLLAEQEAKGRMQLEYKDKLLYGNMQATEDERARIARELHDEVAASLSLLRLQVGSNIEAADARYTIDNVIENVKRITYHLLPPVLKAFGLEVAIQDFANKITSATGMPVTLDMPDGNFRFDELVELSMYRIIQELMHNTLKYAEASRINIGLYFSANMLTLEYKDNGKGYNPESIPGSGGLGLQNIQLRTKLCDGQVRYEYTPDNKIIVRVLIPAREVFKQ